MLMSNRVPRFAVRLMAVLIAALAFAAAAYATLSGEHTTAQVHPVVADPPTSTGGAGPGTSKP